jgi:hypothetical protein
MGEGWDYGFIDHPDHPENFMVSYGTNVMVQTASLHILSLATARRMTPNRVWKLTIRQRYSMSRDDCDDCGFDEFDGINYGKIQGTWGQEPLLVPGLSLDAIVKLEYSSR